MLTCTTYHTLQHFSAALSALKPLSLWLIKHASRSRKFTILISASNMCFLAIGLFVALTDCQTRCQSAPTSANNLLPLEEFVIRCYLSTVRCWLHYFLEWKKKLILLKLLLKATYGRLCFMRFFLQWKTLSLLSAHSLRLSALWKRF